MEKTVQVGLCSGKSKSTLLPFLTNSILWSTTLLATDKRQVKTVQDRQDRQDKTNEQSDKNNEETHPPRLRSISHPLQHQSSWPITGEYHKGVGLCNSLSEKHLFSRKRWYFLKNNVKFSLLPEYTRSRRFRLWKTHHSMDTVASQKTRVPTRLEK